MKKNRILIDILKSLPIYIVMLVIMFLYKYITSLNALFIGEVIGSLNNDSTILPSFLNEFINSSTIETRIMGICKVYLVITILMVISGFLFKFLSRCHRLYLDKLVSKDFYNHILKLKREEFINHSTGDIIERCMSDCNGISNFFSETLYDLFNSLFTLITLLIQIFYLSKINFTISIVYAIIAIILVYYFGNVKMSKYINNWTKSVSKLNSNIQQSLTNYSLIKSYNNEEYEFNKFKEINNQKEENEYIASQNTTTFNFVSDLIITIYSILVMAILGLIYFYKDPNLALITSCLMLSINFSKKPFNLFIGVKGIVSFNISKNRLNEYLNLEDEYQNDGAIESKINGNLEFNNVSLKYPNNTNYTLKNLTFKLDKGQTLAIVGKSGSGKSSISNILTLLDDYSGSIKLDGIELKDYKKEYLRKNISLVCQESYVFSKSIKDNLLTLSKDLNSLDYYLKSTSLDEDLLLFENGVDTQVGERGITLSGGQKQRISLARSLISNRPLLIIDDSLSAIDNLVSKKIIDSLKKEKHTTIIVSHNLLNIKDADKIIVLEKGEIKDIGTHDELINKPGYYQTVWNLQQKLEEVKQ